jgi:MFS family permease
VPIYLSEIGSPKTRGLIGGLGGVGLSLGTMTANWVGFACGYAPYGPVQWRVPLAIQIPWGIILFVSQQQICEIDLTPRYLDWHRRIHA